MGCAAGLGFIVLAGIMTRLLADGAVRASRDRWGRVVRRRGRRRVARLVLLGLPTRGCTGVPNRSGDGTVRAAAAGAPPLHRPPPTHVARMISTRCALSR